MLTDAKYKKKRVGASSDFRSHSPSAVSSVPDYATTLDYIISREAIRSIVVDRRVPRPKRLAGLLETFVATDLNPPTTRIEGAGCVEARL